jgi:hypothetical protein
MDRVLKQEREYAATEKLMTLVVNSTRVSIGGKEAPFHDARVCYVEDFGLLNDNGRVIIGLSIRPDSNFWLESDNAYHFDGYHFDGWTAFENVINVGLLSANPALVKLFPVDSNGIIGVNFYISDGELDLQLNLQQEMNGTEVYYGTRLHISNVGHPDGDSFDQMILELQVQAKYSDVMAIRSATDLLSSSLCALPSLGAEDALLKKVLYTNLLPRMPPVLYAGGNTDKGWFL